MGRPGFRVRPQGTFTAHSGLDTGRILGLPNAMFRTALFLLLLALMAGQPAAAGSGYSLFNPAPDSLLRDLSTDRPDLTESPYTVDAGHVQLEMDLVGYARDGAGGDRTEAWGIAPFMVKLGLTNSTDLQLVLEPHRRVRVTGDPTGATEVSGIGDAGIRLKQNLWGDDGGGTALALMPFVKIPTAENAIGNGAWEWGLIVPFAVGLPWEFRAGLMGEVDLLEDEDGDGRHALWIATATLSRDVTGPLGAFVEVTSATRPRDEGDWVGTFDVGVTLGVGRNVQLDAGVLLGLSDAADDRALFLGLAVRR